MYCSQILWQVEWRTLKCLLTILVDNILLTKRLYILDPFTACLSDWLVVVRHCLVGVFPNVKHNRCLAECYNFKKSTFLLKMKDFYYAI